MKNKTRLRVLVGLAVLGLATAVGVVMFWGPARVQPAADVAADSIGVDQLTSAATQRVFFGHMSVGNNILSGVQQVYRQDIAEGPRVIRIAASDSTPDLSSGGAIVHSLIGANGDPKGKLVNFDAAAPGGLGEKVDVALVKFCYLDVTKGTDVDELFRTYKATFDALERDMPDVVFLHTTVPLTVPPSGIKAHLKALLQGVDNPTRERYNALVRAAYPADRLLDVAAIEGTSPEGTGEPSLYPGYSSDGSHLNGAGSSLVAVRFLQLLADHKVA